MKNLLLSVLILVIPFGLFAQSAEKEINDQVWKPYIAAYKNFDTEKFMMLQSKDVVRITRDQKQIFNFSGYKKNVARENQSNRNYKIQAVVDLRFTERIDGKDLAYETGVYKLNVIKDNIGKSVSMYGRFQFVLRKENGKWKILVDSDFSENDSLTEKDFMAAKAIE